MAKAKKKSAPKSKKSAKAGKASKYKKAAKPAKKAKPVKAVKKPVKKAVKKKVVKKVVKKIKAAKKIAKPVKKAVKKTAKVSKPAKSVKPIKPIKEVVEKKTEVPFNPVNYKPIIEKSKIAEITKQKMPAKVNQDKSQKSRYSDQELKEFKEIILNKLNEAKRELVNLQAALVNANEHGTDDTASTFKMLEDGSDTLAKEEAGQLAARQRKFIEQLENALIRVENKSYGICRVTGKLIPKERLRAVPHTTQSIEAKLQQYRD